MLESLALRLQDDLALRYNDNSVLENHHAQGSWRDPEGCGLRFIGKVC